MSSDVSVEKTVVSASNIPASIIALSKERSLFKSISAKHHVNSRDKEKLKLSKCTRYKS